MRVYVPLLFLYVYCMPLYTVCFFVCVLFAVVCELYVAVCRFGPWFIEPVIAGLTENDEPYICGMDLIGAIEVCAYALVE